MISQLQTEIKIHRELCHKHVVKFEDVFEDKDNVYILMELCLNQTMLELVKRKKRLTESETRRYMLQMVSRPPFSIGHAAVFFAALRSLDSCWRGCARRGAAGRDPVHARQQGDPQGPQARQPLPRQGRRGQDRRLRPGVQAAVRRRAQADALRHPKLHRPGGARPRTRRGAESAASFWHGCGGLLRRVRATRATGCALLACAWVARERALCVPRPGPCRRNAGPG